MSELQVYVPPTPPKPRIRVPAGSSAQRTVDSFQNFQSRVGLGWGNSNPSNGSSYGFNPISRNRTLCEWMYRGSWVVGRAVDAVAEDMTRKGVELKGVEPKDNEQIDQGVMELGVWGALEDNIRWARLFGGSIAIMLIDKQDAATPLRVESIAKGQFKGLLVLDRWVAWAVLSDLVTELGPDLGMPKFYDVPAGMPGLPAMRVHYSRVIRMDGQKLPYFQRWSENYWGASIIEVLYDRLVAFDSATQGVSQLVYRSYLRTIKVDKLREIIAAGGAPLTALVAQMEMIRRFQTNEGITLLDGKDEFDAHSYTFSGLDNVLEQFGDQLCGALRVPRTRMFGESPGGLNSTGESDMQGYEQENASRQNSQMRRGVSKLYQVLHRSILGKPPPENFSFVFKPLREMTEKERAEIAKNTTDGIVQAFDAGIVDRARCLAEMRQSSEITGIWTTISDEDIADAENDPGPLNAGMDDEGGDGEPGEEGGEGGPGPPKPKPEGEEPPTKDEVRLGGNPKVDPNDPGPNVVDLSKLTREDLRGWAAGPTTA